MNYNKLKKIENKIYKLHNEIEKCFSNLEIINNTLANLEEIFIEVCNYNQEKKNG